MSSMVKYVGMICVYHLVVLNICQNIENRPLGNKGEVPVL